jgi:hypothetical protein
MARSGQLCSSFRDAEIIESSIMKVYRSCLITCDLGGYISRKLAQNSSYLDRYIQSPLEFTLTSFISDVEDWIDFAPEGKPRLENVLQSLLQHGYDPNTAILSDLDDADNGPAQTPWESFIARFLHEAEGLNPALGYDAREPNVCFQAIKTGVFSGLLEHGADSNARIDISFLPMVPDGTLQGSSPFWLAWVLLIFMYPDLWRHSVQYLEATKLMFEPDVDIALIMPTAKKNDFKKTGKAWLPNGLHILCSAISLLLDQEDLNPERIQFIGEVIAELAKAIGRTGRFCQELKQLLKDIAPQMQPALLEELRGLLPAGSFPDLEKGLGGVKRGRSWLLPGDQGNRTENKRGKRGGK